MFSRRSVLRGLGACLALPFLPSLDARATGAASQRIFVAYGTPHGGIWPEHMYAPEDRLTQQLSYAGRTVRYGDLVPTERDGTAQLSPVLSAASHRLTPRIAQKMNLLRGIDIPWYIGHHTGGHLGNFARNDANGGDGAFMQRFPTATVDQVLAWHPTFYPHLDGVSARSIAIGYRGMSWGYTRPSIQSGAIVERRTIQDNHTLFQRLFRPGASFGQQPSLLVDHVIESYRRVRDDARLSHLDRQRLEAHMERMYDVERRVDLDIACTPPPPSRSTRELYDDTFHVSPERMETWWQLHHEILVAALACGATRVAVMHAPDTFSAYAGDWHQGVAHMAHLPDGIAQHTLLEAQQRFFSGVYLDLVERLDSVENAQGGTLLDDALVVWTQESGAVTHQNRSIPIVTAGGACGSLNTGHYVDYARREIRLPYEDGQGGELHFADAPGLLWNQWLGTILQSMGIEPSSYEQPGEGGYGKLWIPDPEASLYVGAREVVSERLPVIRT